ncbi:unnamed protein product [Rotaria sp. Silwood1]|nr:unnamed protein product [Rotaria sp. Silwood1]
MNVALTKQQQSIFTQSVLNSNELLNSYKRETPSHEFAVSETVTIEQLFGLRGDILDVHNWTKNNLIDFFHQQGYEYASTLLNKHHINGNKLYELKREQVFLIYQH